jgi:hypothetical protein
VYQPYTFPAADVWPYDASLQYPSRECPVAPKKVSYMLCGVIVEGGVMPGKVAMSTTVF